MEDSTPFWVAFFTEAGIPQSSAATYANLFDQNRIKTDMLLDLNKEYLKDMGVNILGDIIAILKHSKIYHEKVARERVLNAGRDNTETPKAKGILPKEPSLKSIAVPVSKPAGVAQQVVKPSPPKKLRVVQPESTKHQDNFSSEPEEVVEPKRKVIAPSITPIVKQAVKPVAVSASQAAPATKKSSVFQRLGESNVSSTTPDNPDSSSPNTSKSSVFQRLGGVEKESDVISKAAQQPRKILVPTKPKPKAPIEFPTAIKTPVLRMDVEGTPSAQSARQRLGTGQATVTARVRTETAPARIPTAKQRLGTHQPVRQSKTSTGIQQRVGIMKSSVIVNSRGPTSSVSSVFDRLSITKRK